MLDLIDSHCHFDFEVFDNQRHQFIKKCHKLGIHSIVLPAVSAKKWSSLLQTTDLYDELHPALGLHPMFIDQHHPNHLKTLKTLIKQKQPVAIGEIGLDFFNKKTNKALQIEFFQAQLLIAQEARLPVLLHVRKAHDLVLQMLQKTSPKGGICHAFNGDLNQAKRYMKMGFLLGFGGTLTKQNAPKIKHLASHIPLSFIALETDAPDMPTASNQGGINDPTYIAEIVQALADIRSETIEEIAQQTSQNVRQLLKI